ncbi:phage major capsid protein, partial [Bacillus cereus]
MKFTTVAEAFNYYRNHSLAEMEARTAQIKGTIDTDPNADIAAINIEIEGLTQAKTNVQEKQTGNKGDGEMTQRSQFNPITGMNFNQEQQVPTENIFESTEYRSAFYKTLLGQKLTDIETRTFNRAMEIQEAEHRADAFNTTTNSAAVLPTTTLNEVIKKARTMGGLISHCRNFNIPTNISVPIGTPTNKAQWHVEGAPVESEKLSTAAVSFAGY